MASVLFLYLNSGGTKIKTINITIPPGFSTVDILPIADTHIGEASSIARVVQYRIDTIKNTPNMYTDLNGDILNWASVTSCSDTYSETLSPDAQIDKLVELFTELKDKIIAIKPGNHEFRAYRQEGIDITRRACKEAGVEDKYCCDAAMIYIDFNGIIYSIKSIHGTGGGRKAGSKVNRLVDMANITDADIYIHSHTHLPVITRQGFYRNCGTKHEFVDQLFVNTGATLQYGGYAEAFEFIPASLETPIIHLDGMKKRYTATL